MEWACFYHNIATMSVRLEVLNAQQEPEAQSALRSIIMSTLLAVLLSLLLFGPMWYPNSFILSFIFQALNLKYPHRVRT